MRDGSGPDGLATKDGAKALSGAASVDTATTQLDKPSRTKNSIIEYKTEKEMLLEPLFSTSQNPPLNETKQNVSTTPWFLRGLDD